MIGFPTKEELEIRFNPFETAVAYDHTGRVLFKRKGGAHGVSLTTNQRQLCQSSVSVMTHNHPPYLDNSLPPSLTDIGFVLNTQIQMRVITPSHLYVVKIEDHKELKRRLVQVSPVLFSLVRTNFQQYLEVLESCYQSWHEWGVIFYEMRPI